ncbi:MAG: septum formation initiator family protein [Alphaproteobacteria bacterium]|nr:septum formation initiator family protein [Alphaproteobacteria bacterium]MDE2341476.1 septum formation initiator family protein [Alphaproteobacteria bacterium]
MKRAHRFWHLLSDAAVPAIAFGVIGFFGAYALFGSNGILAWGDYQRALHQRQAALQVAQIERARLQNRVDLLNPAHDNPDLVDELVRQRLGVVSKDEVILPLK